MSRVPNKVPADCLECAELSELYWAAWAEEVGARGELRLVPKTDQGLKVVKLRQHKAAQAALRSIAGRQESHGYSHRAVIEKPVVPLDPDRNLP